MGLSDRVHETFAGGSAMKQGAYMSVYRYWIWIGIPLMLAAAAALWILITGVISLTKRALLFKVPLVAKQEIGFEESGRIALSMEGPRFTTRFAGVNFQLRELDGQSVPSRPSLMRTRTMGTSTITMELMTFDIPRPGRYVLLISGLDEPSVWEPAHAVVFMRPHMGQTVAYIVGIVMAACVFIASLVFVIMRLARVGLDG